jgi:hypothetical protein
LFVRLWGKISGFFSNITDRILRFFGIRSPSTVFAGIGKNLAEGLGVGFEGEPEKVARDMQNAIPSSFDVDASVRGNYSGEYGGNPQGGGTTNHITINSPKAISEKEAAREFRNLSRKLAIGVV